MSNVARLGRTLNTGPTADWEYLFIGSRQIRTEFQTRVGWGATKRLGMVLSAASRDEYAAKARHVVNEMLAEYAGQGWELVAVVPYQALFGRRVGFEWYFKRPVRGRDHGTG